MARTLRLEVPEFQSRYWQSRLAYDEAALDPAAYWNIVAGRELPYREIERMNELDGQSWTYAAPVMPAWARQVRAAGIRTAILSNMPLPVREALDRKTWLPEFDHRTFSCDVRLAKPGPDIYLHSLRGLGMAARDVLFLDDRPENVRAAESLGIPSILFTNARNLAEEICGKFDIPPPPVDKVEGTA